MTASTETVLFDYWRSSASYRVRIALGLAGLSWQTVPIDLVEGNQRAPEHLDRNPQGLVPVLEIDGLRLTQSLAILEYLDETRGLELLPATASERARVRALAHAIAMEIHPVCNLRVAKHAVSLSNGQLTMKDWMQAFIAPGLAAVEAMAKGPDFLYAGRLSLADLCLVPQIYNARRWDVDLSGFPKLVEIDAHLNTIPAFAAAHPDNCPR